MGLIIGPLMLMWLVAFGLSLRVGYLFASATGYFPEALIAFGLAFVLAVVYAASVLGRRRHEKELWSFQYGMDFALHPLGLSLYTICALYYLFGGDFSDMPGTLGGLFIVMLGLSMGTLMGVSGADDYMKRNDIEGTF